MPPSLPDWLVPESKAHLVQATRALSGTAPSFPSTPSLDDDDDDDTPGLKDGFDWYMRPADKSKYESIYTTNANKRTGLLAFQALNPLYESLDVPDTDLRSAWNLVNPASDPAISKHAALAFLHILNMRHEGFRIPRSVPASLRATFDQGTIDYNVESHSGGVRAKSGRSYNADADAAPDTSTARKAKFGDAYLSRLGGRSAGYNPSGTDFSSTSSLTGGVSNGSADTAATDGEWESVRLRRQLVDLESQIARVEASSSSRGGGGGPTSAPRGGRREDRSKPALVKRELENLLDYKRGEMRELEGAGGDDASGGSGGGGRVRAGEAIKGLEAEIGEVRVLVEGLERHMRGREEVLETLRREIEAEKRGGGGR